MSAPRISESYRKPQPADLAAVARAERRRLAIAISDILAEAMSECRPSQIGRLEQLEDSLMDLLGV